jgi:hypothetical protein
MSEARNFNQQHTEVVAIGATSAIVRPTSFPISVSAIPESGGTATVLMTFDTIEAVIAGTAKWFNWEEIGNRAAGKKADIFNAPITAIKCSAAVAAVNFAVLVA